MTGALPRLDGAFDAVSSHALDRRQLLRAGAWAAPALVLATAAPAAANTSPVVAGASWEFSDSALSYRQGSWPQQTLDISLRVKNTSTSTPIKGAVVVTARFAKTLVGTPAPAAALAPGSTWVASGGPASSASDWVYTFTTAQTLAPGATSDALAFSVTSPSIAQATDAALVAQATSSHVNPGVIQQVQTAVPAAPTGNVPLATLTVGTFGVWNNSGNGSVGPFKGNLQIDFNNKSHSFMPPSPIAVPYWIEVLTPGATAWERVLEGSASITASQWYGQFVRDWSYGTTNMPRGRYQFRVSVSGSDGSAERKSASTRK